MMEDYYSQLPPEVRMDADNSAEWFIELLIEAAKSKNKPLTKSQIWILKHPFWEFNDDLRQEVITTNNQAVEIIREIVLKQVQDGVSSMKVREGLWVPVELEEHYEKLFKTEQNWFVSSVLQNAFLGNPLNDEDENWTPNNKPKRGKSTEVETVPSNDESGENQSRTVEAFVLPILIFVIVVIVAIISVGSYTGNSSSLSSDTTEEQVDPETLEEQVEAPVDTGADVPGDFWDDGEFAWQWVSSPVCTEGTVCSQVRVFSKYDCPYEVWINWKSINDSTGETLNKQDAIPPMGRGATSSATLATPVNSFTKYFEYSTEMGRISCGQTG